MKIKTTLLLLLSSFMLHPSAFSQGPLAPPPGEPGPTFKTLGQIEPRKVIANLPGGGGFNYVIAQGGSYYLTGDLAVDKDNGINVIAPGVTIDLNGFRIIRTGGPLGGTAISISGPDCTVKNGSLNAITSPGFANGVVDTGTGGTFTSLRIQGCTQVAIDAGENATVTDCIVSDNTNGIRAGKASVLTRCIARRTVGAVALQAGQGSTLTNCVAELNQTTSAFLVDQGSSLQNCTGFGNKSAQVFFTSTGVALTGCAAVSNTTDYGFRVGAGSTLTDCTARSNTSSAATSYGIYAADSSTLIGCTSSSNVTSNGAATDQTGIGIFGGVGSTVKDCTSGLNKGIGIQVAIGSTVTGCTARSNGNDGIRAPNDCLIARNSCSQNGAVTASAGIHVTSQGNRIEENHLVFNSNAGIRVTASNNLVIRNSSRFNNAGTANNYVIVSGNFVGAIVTTDTGLESANNSTLNISY